MLKPGAAVSSSKRAREDDGDSDIPSKEARLGGIGKTIIARNLPEDCTPQMLTMLFQQHPGFVDVRIAPGNKGVAFIDFEQDVQGSMAVKQLNGFQLTSSSSLQLELS